MRVESRLPTGDVVRGTGSVVRWVGESDPLGGCEGAVVALNGGEHVEPWCYRDVAVFVPQAECSPLA